MSKQMTAEEINLLMAEQRAKSLMLILDSKKVDSIRTLLLIFYRYPNGDIQFSVGSRYYYEVPKDRMIDYWQHAEYYSNFKSAYKVFNSIKV